MAAKKSLDAKVRPLGIPTLEKTSLLGAARLYVSKDSYISLTGGLESGRHCAVEKLDAGAGDAVRREASLWVLPEKNLSPNVVLVSRAFQDAAGLKVGDQVRVTLLDGQTPDADEVVVQEVGEAEGEAEVVMKHSPCWEASLSLSLDRAEMAFPGMVFDNVSINRLRRTFIVLSVNGQHANLARFKLASTTIKILPKDQPEQPVPDAPAGDLVVTGVPGLAAQVLAINRHLRRFTRPFWVPGERESCGLVVHGGHGTGKTLILQRVAATNWGRAHWIRPGDKLSTIREVFKQAQAQQPCMILMDGLEDLVDKDRSNRDSVIEAIGDELDALSAAAKANNALPKVVVMATCLDYMTDVPAKLQKRSRFRRNIALPIPRAAERLEILQHLDPPIRSDAKQQCLKVVADKTHAFNGDDLASLVENAKEILGNRLDEAGADPAAGDEHFLTMEDLDQALRVTRPTAMHDINLKPPTIHWEDVGGQESLKKVLRRMIKYTKSTNPAIQRVLRNPPKGLLLYGPPGCSKTLSAQAMATESGFNFFAVKGAELLNMYVGESERAVRTLFERARAASPSIIFFDEIDSIGGQRSGPGGSSGGGGGSSRSNGAVNMLTTLLTEMDGFESLTGVLVLAATNRPEAIDPALMRPGRFDQVLYVGPPDHAAREAVFRVHLRGLSLAPDVDIAQLAALADGYSGAEIQAICNEAGVAVQDRYEEADDDSVKLEIAMADLTAALERAPRNITGAMILGYEMWSKQFRKT
ncbi:hypothetical protein S7711_00426 [Stachybotrys chartarum IBT 7711]|uniref:AAA+ ATPase domain-containing protein n=1 Tax=Stachybotrys chartarum (strain CBS 109288 / IBT 7711) TaxID=1280523 RepID=A0A084B9N9_STACB|nr:hypothetical protein S7711_00426 [Stachybotrys chartarum IBT 7711]